MTSGDDILAALAQQLECDRLLGVKSAPILWPESLLRPGSARPKGASRAAPRTESTRLAGAQVEHSRFSTPPSSADAQSRNGDAAAKAELLRILDETHVKGCRKCGLCETRTKTVFGQGNASPRLVFVGEAPGYDEDKQGLAFVGKAGQLLTRMIAAMGLTRDDVFICNVLKCRPPNNRDPLADEILACSPYLREQLSILQPEIIVALGAPASKTLLNTAQAIGKLRGRFHDYYLSGVTGQGSAIPLMPTYHPAYLLRNPEDKRKAWDDLQMVMRQMGLPARQSTE